VKREVAGVRVRETRRGRATRKGGDAVGGDLGEVARRKTIEEAGVVGQAIARFDRPPVGCLGLPQPGELERQHGSGIRDDAGAHHGGEPVRGDVRESEAGHAVSLVSREPAE